jgi:hypothetical protein
MYGSCRKKSVSDGVRVVYRPRSWSKARTTDGQDARVGFPRNMTLCTLTGVATGTSKRRR